MKKQITRLLSAVMISNMMFSGVALAENKKDTTLEQNSMKGYYERTTGSAIYGRTTGSVMGFNQFGLNPQEIEHGLKITFMTDDLVNYPNGVLFEYNHAGGGQIPLDAIVKGNNLQGVTDVVIEGLVQNLKNGLYSFNTTGRMYSQLFIEDREVLSGKIQESVSFNGEEFKKFRLKYFGFVFEPEMNHDIDISWTDSKGNTEIIPNNNFMNTNDVINLMSSGLKVRLYGSKYVVAGGMENVDLVAVTKTVEGAKMNLAKIARDMDVSIREFKVIKMAGRILPEFTDTYVFSTNDDENVRLWINNHLVINEGKSAEITLTGGTDYPIVVEYNTEEGSAPIVKLNWESGSFKKEIVPQRNLKNDGINTNFIENYSPVMDSDGDGIPNSWEINGYTVLGTTIVPYKDGMNGEKYVTSPESRSTDMDPYTDFEEVTGIGMDRSVVAPANHPLIPAYPIIEFIPTSMNIREKVINTESQTAVEITNSQNKDVIYDNSKTKDTYEGTDHRSFETSVGVKVDIATHDKSSVTGYVKTKTTNGRISTNGSSDESTTGSGEYESNGEGTSDSSANTTVIDTKNYANLYINGYYINRGTAAIYDMDITLNVADDALKTVGIAPSALPKALSPYSRYPESGDVVIKHSKNWDKSKAYTPLNLNKTQADTLNMGFPFELSLTDLTGDIKKISKEPIPYENGKERIKFKTIGKWNSYMNNIDSVSATLEIRFPHGVVERKIYAENRDMSFMKALKLLYKTKNLPNGNLEVEGHEIGNSVLDQWKIEISGAGTMEEVLQALNIDGNNPVLDLEEITLAPGVKITLSQAEEKEPQIVSAIYDHNREKVIAAVFGIGSGIDTVTARINEEGNMKKIVLKKSEENSYLYESEAIYGLKASEENKITAVDENGNTAVKEIEVSERYKKVQAQNGKEFYFLEEPKVITSESEIMEEVKRDMMTLKPLATSYIIRTDIPKNEAWDDPETSTYKTLEQKYIRLIGEEGDGYDFDDIYIDLKVDENYGGRDIMLRGADSIAIPVVPYTHEIIGEAYAFGSVKIRELNENLAARLRVEIEGRKNTKSEGESYFKEFIIKEDIPNIYKHLGVSKNDYWVKARYMHILERADVQRDSVTGVQVLSRKEFGDFLEKTNFPAQGEEAAKGKYEVIGYYSKTFGYNQMDELQVTSNDIVVPQLKNNEEVYVEYQITESNGKTYKKGVYTNENINDHKDYLGLSSGDSYVLEKAFVVRDQGKGNIMKKPVVPMDVKISELTSPDTTYVLSTGIQNAEGYLIQVIANGRDSGFELSVDNGAYTEGYEMQTNDYMMVYENEEKKDAGQGEYMPKDGEHTEYIFVNSYRSSQGRVPLSSDKIRIQFLNGDLSGYKSARIKIVGFFERTGENRRGMPAQQYMSLDKPYTLPTIFADENESGTIRKNVYVNPEYLNMENRRIIPRAYLIRVTQVQNGTDRCKVGITNTDEYIDLAFSPRDEVGFKRVPVTHSGIGYFTANRANPFVMPLYLETGDEFEHYRPGKVNIEILGYYYDYVYEN